MSTRRLRITVAAAALFVLVSSCGLPLAGQSTNPPGSEPTVGSNPADLLPTIVRDPGALGAETAVPVALVGLVAADAPVHDRPSEQGTTVLGQVRAGETVTLQMQNGDGSWYGIVTSSGLQGWVRASLLTVAPAVARQVPLGLADKLDRVPPADAPGAPAEITPTE